MAVRPNPATILGGLKDFQRRTVEHVHRRFFLDDEPTDRFLVADEVGLGKTMVARGVAALAIDHLWERTGRLDVVYICSNAEIAHQNINRLRLNRKLDFTKPTRLSLLPREVSDLRGRKLNFISLTPGTSFETHSAMGRSDERQVLFQMLRDEWDLKGARAWNLFAGDAGRTRFRKKVLWRERYGEIDEELWDRFLAALAESDEAREREGQPGLRKRYEELLEDFGSHRSRIRNQEVLDAQRHLIGDLRSELARSCVDALEPDLVILDEFQRFKHLLNRDTDAGLLAHALFDWTDDETDEGAKTLLLSATPYKAYVTSGEVDDADHYGDFLATARFLLREDAKTEELGELLGEFRRIVLRWGDLDSRRRLTEVKARIEEILRSGIARTERLAQSSDRDGMLREVRPAGAELTSSDVHAYLTAQDVAWRLDQNDPLEFWKSSPYLLNLMDKYKLKGNLMHLIEGGSGMEGYGAIAEALARPKAGLIDWQAIESYRELDPGNARMRSLATETLGQDLWRLLWVPPSLPYYALRGPYATDEARAFTKRLVFSSWAVVPKAVSLLLSYEAERRMALSYSADSRNDARERRNRGGRLRIGYDTAERRLLGMPVLALTYPSFALAEAVDPAALRADTGRLQLSADEAMEETERRVETLLQPALSGAPTSGRHDERWYWAAPLVLDARMDERRTLAFLNDGEAVAKWAGGRGEDAGGESWPDHIHEAYRAASGDIPLGPPPVDLTRVLAELALAGPAVTALRSLGRGHVTADALRSTPIRTAAARVAWALRSLFNASEVTDVVRSADGDSPYWREVLGHCVDGCLQATMDEFVHVQTEAQGHVSDSPDPGVTEEVAEKITEAIGIRTTRAGIDLLESDGTTIETRSRNMRARFALRFGDQTGDDGAVLARADHVRTAFNSPFWPFVLASTSVGQEGLDFHLYSHAVVHWNLPSNPVDLEQREGRVHRYKGHAVRKNVALTFGAQVLEEGHANPWARLFELAVDSRPTDQNELWPFWIFAPPNGDGMNGATILREVPALPLSRDIDRLRDLKSALTMYRSVLGQARQEDLLEVLANHVRPEERETVSEMLRIDLSPPDRPPLDLPDRPDEPDEQEADEPAAQDEGVESDHDGPRRAPSPRPGLPELSPAYGDMPLDWVAEAYETGSDKFRALLEELARLPDQPRTNAEVEGELGWKTGTIASLFGGYSNRSKVRWDRRRPFRLGRDGGTWWVWMDVERAAVIDRLQNAPT